MSESLGALIKRVGELQPSWTSENTKEMKERGVIIRKRMPEYLNLYRSQFRESLDSFGDGFGIEASDGIGRKTEAPWVRLFSHHMSPNARTGYYVVYHFSADGERFYVTLGFGSTIWNKDRGDLVDLPPEDLESRRRWSLSVLRDKKQDYSSFSDTINLGARASLPRQFEKATLLARVFDTKNAKDERVIEFTCQALKLLAQIYSAQTLGKHLSSSQEIESKVLSITRPQSLAKARQGYGLTGKERKAVELQAMYIAGEYLKSKGFKVKDTSSNHPYDILASNRDKDIKVEVKGTTVKNADTVLMTRNEVKLHREEQGDTALIVVSGIELEDRDKEPKAMGGELKVFLPWDITPCGVDPIAYEIQLKL